MRKGLAEAGHAKACPVTISDLDGVVLARWSEDYVAGEQTQQKGEI